MLLGAYLNGPFVLPESSVKRDLRHIDIVDHYEPVMLIVGSRGLGNLKGYVPSRPTHPLLNPS